MLAAPREGVQGGRAGIDHLSGTRRHLQFPENPEDRTEAEQHSFSHSAAVCVHRPATFPLPLHAFWRAWARKIINLVTILNWRKKKDHHRIADAGTAGSRLLWALDAANPMGNPLVRHGCGIRTGHLGFGRQRWQVAFLKAILTLHRETLHFDRRQPGMTCPLRLHPLAFAGAEKRSAHGETSAVCLFNLQRLPNLACWAQTIRAESRVSVTSCQSHALPAVPPRVAPWKKIH